MELLQGRPGGRSQAGTAGGELRSVIQVKPQIQWPSLDDADADIDDFLERFEETVGLANDGMGMAERERLRVLGSCLKQSRQKVYRVVTKAARRTGELERDPGAVYQQIVLRLQEFKEGLIEKQTRISREWDALTKGKLTALQFLPLFEHLVSELELCGLAKGERELLLLSLIHI